MEKYNLGKPVVRQCWLNIETGEFSKSWFKGEFGNTVESILSDNSIDIKWKLIEYSVLNDKDFEFMDCMRLR
ncbi:MAG: hypothetical protein CL489_08630 [Acidobacteria bacterium]|nr:hypothetical protein [Acidobacteriota bacterium]|tara:strand:- start:36475 stop:36690 length:216 start_codon:yes stop_codon:yes gene_type:complete